jgi:hypothetical protein
LARADHDRQQKTGVNKLGEAERPLQISVQATQDDHAEQVATETNPN